MAIESKKALEQQCNQQGVECPPLTEKVVKH